VSNNGTPQDFDPQLVHDGESGRRLCELPSRRRHLKRHDATARVMEAVI
jgi:hypothetical protein